MTSVWYVGPDAARVMSPPDWSEAGTDASTLDIWDVHNGWSIPTEHFSAGQLAFLESYPEEFLTNAPSGPRSTVLLPPEQFVTLNQLREMLTNFTFPPGLGFTPANVGLDKVDNTSDAEKPISAATQDALNHKADYPDGGTNGQVLVKSGSTTAWATGGGGATQATAVDDPRLPSGKAYTLTGGVAPTTDSRLPSGTAYTIGS